MRLFAGKTIPTPKIRHSFAALQTLRFAYLGYKTIAYSRNVKRSKKL
jgi:hypothetical protein